MWTQARIKLGTGLLLWIQVLFVAAYGYALVAYALTDAEYFPEQAPPAWAWPAVLAVGIGWLPAALCLLLAGVVLFVARRQTGQWRWRWLGVVTVACAVTLLVMVSPVGWGLFDWYVS